MIALKLISLFVIGFILCAVSFGCLLFGNKLADKWNLPIVSFLAMPVFGGIMEAVVAVIGHKNMLHAMQLDSYWEWTVLFMTTIVVVLSMDLSGAREF
ncbi:hypothetical protein lbkm_4104 [Lachnospiraceae bacterium KM106-2]|nr:hypothetical protein lbkm_4104 [Lachnospiraceae bacterium KM106-2]